MNKIIQGDFGKNRCRNSEAEKKYNAPVVSLTEPELTFDQIALSDRILDLMEDPNGATKDEKDFWFNFWEANSDVWLEMISINHNQDIRKLDTQQLRYRVSVLFNFLQALNLSAETQAIEERNDES